jgi:cell division protein FtsB
MIKPKPNNKTIKQQVKMYCDVEAELIKEGKMITNQNIATGLEAKGLKSLTRGKLYRLKQTASEKNNFVLNIARSQYSAMVQDIYDKILFIEDKISGLAEDDWTMHETETSSGDGDHANFEKTKTIDNQHKPRHDFYRLLLDCQTAKTKILSGDVMNVSIAMIEQNFNKLRDERDEYLKEIKRLREIIKDNGNN